MLTGNVLGLPIPDAGPVFAIALTVHLGGGLTAVICGALAAGARKRPGRHPRAGRIYLWALSVIFTTATIMAIIRWHEDAHLFAIGTVAFGLGLYGYQPAEDTTADGRHGTPQAWPAPTSPCSPASTSTTAHCCPHGTGSHTRPTGSCPQPSAHR